MPAARRDFWEKSLESLENVMVLSCSLLPAAGRSQSGGGSLHWEHLLNPCSWFADTTANTDSLEEENCGTKFWGALLCSGWGSWSRVRLGKDTEAEFRGSSLRCYMVNERWGGYQQSWVSVSPTWWCQEQQMKYNHMTTKKEKTKVTLQRFPPDLSDGSGRQ